MMRAASVVLSLLALSASVCAQGGTVQHPYTLTIDGNARTYYVYVPSTYKPGTPTATVIYIHGFNMQCQGTNEVAGYTSLSVARQFLLVTPCAMGNPTQWSIDDIDFIEAALSDVKKNYDVDQSRLFLTGFSNGGAMTELLTCTYPTWFAGSASVSGWQFRGHMGNYSLSNRQVLAACDATFAAGNHQLPMLHIHGHEDDLVAYFGFTGLPSVRDDFYGWALRNNCTGSPTTTLEDSIYKDEMFENCPAPAGSRLITLYNQGHVWLRSAEFDTNTIILDHFKVTAPAHHQKPHRPTHVPAGHMKTNKHSEPPQKVHHGRHH